MKGGWELQAKSHFELIRGIRGIMPAGHFLCAGIVLESRLLGIGRPILSKINHIALGRPRRPPWQPKAPPSGPRAAQGTQKDPKVVPGREKEKTAKGEQQTTKLYTHKRIIRKLSIQRHTAAG